MDCTALVLEKLSLRGIDAVVNEYDISWMDDAGTENYIQLKNIDCSGKNLAWFQSSEKDDYVLSVYEDDRLFNWVPVSHNLYFGCSCCLLEWYKDHLVFIYTEKHDTYICSVRNSHVRTFNFHGNRMERNKDLIFFRGHEDESAIVRRLRIPELEEMELMNEQEARAAGFVPQLVVFTNELKNK